jgi:hypothetical protein
MILPDELSVQIPQNLPKNKKNTPNLRIENMANGKK